MTKRLIVKSRRIKTHKLLSLLATSVADKKKRKAMMYLNGYKLGSLNY